ncbi:MAG TPA: GNAT family protein [Thermoplasmata archaeon]|nr:GNAT family protein [Thermoplasmata archaeon]
MDRSAAPPRSPFPALETARLVLREITLDDTAFWLRHFSDPEIVEMTAFEPPADREAAKGELLRYAVHPFEQGTGIRWGMALRGSPELIGTLGYHGWVREGGDRARMGYDLAREHRGRGLMSEAMRAVLAHGFDRMRLNRVEALIDPTNGPSIRLVERLGFRREGVLRENTYFRGRFIDDAVYALLVREWRGALSANR